MRLINIFMLARFKRTLLFKPVTFCSLIMLFNKQIRTAETRLRTFLDKNKMGKQEKRRGRTVM